jgi:hypothetical protein
VEAHSVETSRLPCFLDSQFTDGGQVVSLTRRPPFTPRKIPVTHFCYRLSRPQGHSAAGRIRSIEKSNDLIRNRTRDQLRSYKYGASLCVTLAHHGCFHALLQCPSSRLCGSELLYQRWQHYGRLYRRVRFLGCNAM